ncbi:taste receptor type 1 member 3-like [Solea solea]|uniref:taste receptor type 1 member 3-like n=1 Tax=Solea solea TaxID=90069 RepID=UPI00272CD2E9|nr:taste receptor type 1 member 3-like [Solea solea]
MVSPFILLVLCWQFRLGCCVNGSPEWFNDISTNLFSLPGDIMLGGLFSINDLSSNLSQRTKPNNISCEKVNELGLGLSIVMKYAVDEINANQILLPGIKLGYETYDTCKQAAVIVRPTLSFLTAKSTKALSVECNYTNYEPRISAVIGPYSSELVSVIGKVLGFFLMPQISYGATSDKFSDNLHYPSFFRTVPTDKWQVEVMALLLREFAWNWVAVVGSDEEYGQRGVEQFSKLAEAMSICVAYQALIPVYTNPEPAIRTIVRNIIATKVHVVVVFSDPPSAEIFFSEVIRRNMTAVWIASTGWAVHYRLTTLPNIQSIGTVIGFTDRTQNLDLLPVYTHKLFAKISEERQSMSGPVPTADPSNPCPQCWYLSPANITLVTAPAVQRSAFGVYAAIYSVAEALHNLLDCNSTACKWGLKTKIYPWELLRVLRNTSVNVSGTHLVFDSNGNPNIGYNVIQWKWGASGLDFMHVGTFYESLSINKSLFRWHTEDSKVPESRCSAECDKGQIRRVKGFHSCCYDCIDCLPGTYRAYEDDIECTECPKGQWSLIRSTSCTKPTFVVLSWDTPEALAMILAGVLLLLCQVSVGAVFLKHRQTPMVMASGGTQSLVALLSLIGGCLSLLLFLGQLGDTKCRLQLPLTCFFQTGALSIVTSISLQIFYVTEFPDRAASQLHIIRGYGSWLFVLVCCVVQASLCSWFGHESPSLSEHMAHMTITFVNDFLACPVIPLTAFALMQGFNALLALVSFMATFMAVKPLHQYNLARDITFSCLIYCVIWLTFIPVYIGLSDKGKSIVHVSFDLGTNLGVVVAYYVPKCYLLLRKPDLNKPEQFCTFLEAVPPRPVEQEPQT